MHCSLHYNISKLNAMTDNMFALLVFGFNVLAGSLISTVVCQSTENSTEADDSYLIWTSFNPSDSTSKILSLPADLEKVHMEQKYQILEESNPGASVEYWALAGNYEKNILFYTDYKSEQIELLDIEEHKSKSIFQGIAHGIESLAYDWVTENLYWIDVRFNWIVTSEKTFNYFTPIYRSDQKLFALTLHAKRRKLYFSTYKSMGCGIMVTDLAGRGEETLFEFPANCSVCGITVDYTDERLYWTDYYGAGSRILSSNLDGSDKKQHGEKHFMAVLWDVTVYKNNIYVTDCHSYEPEHRTTGYRIWSVSKATNTSKFKTYNERPRRITVLSKNENRPSLNVSAIGECDSQPKCDHICLPRLNATRECVCALGYYKQGDTQCKEQLIDDEFMYVVDKNQGKIFQISLNGSNNENWNLSIVPVTNFTDKVEKVNHIATDIETGYLYWYWSNPRQTTLSRSLPNKTQKEDLQRYKHVDNLIVDPRTKNVYFVGSDTKVIYVLSPNGTYEAELVNNLAKDVKIKDIALDSVNRKIYWTAIHNEYVDQGEVWRMNLNGLGRELVMDKLYWPSAIHVDQESSSLFVGEVKRGIVIQVPLDLLRDVTNTSWESVAKRYNVFKFKNTTSNESYYILDIKVHKGRFFFVEDITRRIYAFNLSGGIDNLMPFGPNVFYKPSSLAIYSQLFHKSYIENIPSPCQERPTPCPHICVDLSDTSSQCLCQTHSFLKGEKCVDYTQTSNSPPFINLNCGKVDNVPADDCKDFATMSWPDFKWTDDWTPTEKLKVVTPKLPKTLKVDSYLYHLRATDEHEQMTECSFSIRVYQNLCHNYPKLPNGMIKSNRTCGKQAGSKYNITCKNPKEHIYFDYHAKDTILNVCHQGSWSTQNLNGAYCLNPAAAETENIRIFNVTTEFSIIMAKTWNKGVIFGTIIGCALLFAAVMFFSAIMLRRYKSHLARDKFLICWKRKTNRQPETKDFTDSNRVGFHRVIVRFAERSRENEQSQPLRFLHEYVNI